MGFPGIQELVMTLPGIIIGFAFHEFAHAITATWFGDDTPRLMGRVTLNPMAHLDPLGTLLLLLGTIGWAKPVEVNVNRLRPRVLGDIAVSLAGVGMNFLLAVLFFVLAGLAYRGAFGFQHPALEETLFQTAWINVVMVGFNLLPIPPLDGFRVLRYALPGASNQLLFNLYRFGPMVLILLVYTRVLNLMPVYDGVLKAVTAVAAPILNLLG